MTDIAIINDQHIFSGTSTHIYKIFTNLAAKGINAEFYQFLMYEENPPLSTLHIKKGIFSTLSSKSKFVYNTKLALNFMSGYNWRVFKSVTADTVLLSGPTLLPLVGHYKRTIVIGHDLFFIDTSGGNIFLANYMRRLYRLFDKADLVMVNSNYTKRDFIKRLQIKPDKLNVVYPSFDSKDFHPGPSNIKSTLNLNQNDKIILSVGGDNPNKNVENIMRALQMLPDNYKLIRVGRSFNTIKLINQLRIQNRTFLLGNVGLKNLADLYRGSDVFVFPSFFEGFGIPLVEAMASGTPVVTSNRGSMPEVVGDAGIICDPFDVDGIAHAILKLTNEDQIRRSYVSKGLARSGLFTQEKQSASLLK
ncbi:MAG: glycosyltransferase family 1 protein, partial [Thermoplasmatales archaeon]